MDRLEIVATDLVAICVLVFGVYFPRYRRRGMVVAYLGLNVCVLAVAVALSSNTTIGTGFGIGLFGALSIVRLRSDELSHQEVAYYFASLALGLLGGIEVTPAWLNVALPVLIVVAMAVGDHPRLLSGHRQQVVQLDRAIADERELVEHLSDLLGATILHSEVRRLDLVNDTTTVDVRFRVGHHRAREKAGTGA